MKPLSSFVAIVLGLVLNSAVYCNGGKTSVYVRKVEKTEDMPLNSDVFRVPPGYNAPQQVHITQDHHDGKAVIVSWVTEDEPGSSAVFYWSENTKHKEKGSRQILKDLQQSGDVGKLAELRYQFRKQSKRNQIRVGVMAADEGKVKIEKFDGADFGFWKMPIEDFLQTLGVIRVTLSRNVALNIAKEKTTTILMAALSKASVAQHLNELNTITTQLSSVEIEFDDKVRALILLSSLPDSWNATVTTVSSSSRNIKLKFDDFQDLILSEEIRRRESGEASSSSALHTESRGRTSERNSNSGRSKSRRGKSGTGKKDYTCYNCGKKGHFKRDCQASKKDTGAQESANMTEETGDAMILSVNNPIESWILDSGASFHSTPCQEIMENYVSGDFGKVHLVDDETLKIVGKGDIRLNEWKITKRALTIARGKKTGTLYVNSNLENIIAASDADGKSNIWHQRLGYMSEKGMKTLLSKGKLSDLKSVDVGLCEDCIFGKQKKVSFAKIGKTPKAEKSTIESSSSNTEAETKEFAEFEEISGKDVQICPEAVQEEPGTPELRRSSRTPKPTQRYFPSLHYLLLTDNGEQSAMMKQCRKRSITSGFTGSNKSTMGENATKQDWLSKAFSKKKLDVKTAFLHGDLEEEIYMRRPEGFIEAYKKNQFAMKDLGTAKQILGMRIKRDTKPGTLILSQAEYINKVLSRFNMQDVKPVSTPLGVHFRLSKEQSPKMEEERTHMVKVTYASAIGSRMYVMIYTRPYIAHAVGAVSRDTILTGYVDADLAGNVDIRKSNTWYVYNLVGTAVSWVSQLQKIVALSTTEAEYVVVTEASKEMVWLQSFLEELGKKQENNVLYCNIQSAIQLEKNPSFHSRTKHIQLRYHFIWSLLEDGILKLEKISGAQNPADMLTKTYNTRYYYEVGLDHTRRTFWFTTPPSVGPNVPYAFGLIGDLGQSFDSNSTLTHYEQIHRKMSPAHSHIDCGTLWYENLERDLNSLVLREREGGIQPAPRFRWVFRRVIDSCHRTPRVKISLLSLTLTGIMFLSEHRTVPHRFGKCTPQYQWLEAELPKVNRSETPWLIVLMHSPWYKSYNYHYMEGESMRERISNIAYNVVNGICIPVKDQSAPVYITIGDRGNLEGLATNMTEPQPAYSAYREASFGHAIFDIKNRTHAYCSWHRNHDGYAVEADSMWVFNRFWHPVDETSTSQ
ncbi:Purple acid phosphatase 10 [Hibiscus syriacus]|uniref:Purple acid phosphatase 10 n=1 Tax=Hibiscus syriacus TaxID=106335 RepID=A0A6A3CA72_HIBSY|nr:Purple acid phosphatase 10 [Hibiscus syriacus]